MVRSRKETVVLLRNERDGRREKESQALAGCLSRCLVVGIASKHELARKISAR